MVVSRTLLFVLFHLAEPIPSGKPIVKIATLSFWLMGNRKYPFDDLGAAQIVISRITRSLTWRVISTRRHGRACRGPSTSFLPRDCQDVDAPAPGYAKASPGFGASSREALAKAGTRPGMTRARCKRATYRSLLELDKKRGQNQPSVFGGNSPRPAAAGSAAMRHGNCSASPSRVTAKTAARKRAGLVRQRPYEGERNESHP